MDNTYFVYNGQKYIIEYKDETINIYKQINGNLESLSDEENKKISELLNSGDDYIYDSAKLNELVINNPAIERKDFVMNFLNWLEDIIPEDCRENFYRNVATLKTALNLHVISSDLPEKIDEYTISGGYNTINNSLTINETYLYELIRIANTSADPKDFFWRQYCETLLHELAHMASSKFNPDTKVALCGFDTFPPGSNKEKNRGLTEGFTEIIAMAGVPGTAELSSMYYVEASLINQMIQLIGKDVFIKAYFTNQGTAPMEEKLNEIIDDPTMSSSLFRNIELNFSIRHVKEEQNVLGNIQLTLLDYLEKKLEVLFANNEVDEIGKILSAYEMMMVTPEKLEAMQRDPQLFVGVEESISRFSEIKNKYTMCLVEDNDMAGVKK